MSYRIACYTLFDITPTGVLNRSRPTTEQDQSEWLLKRNTQCNFDTVLQTISLRSQPEITAMPEKIAVNFNEETEFGFLFEQEDTDQSCWVFEFEIMHPSVFDDGISDLGALYNDCDGVPMIKCGTEWDKLPAFLDTTPEMRNIYFKMISDGS